MSQTGSEVRLHNHRRLAEGTRENSDGPPSTDGRYFVLATALFLLATLSKPTGAILPLLVLPMMYLRWKHPPRRIWKQMAFWIVLGAPIMILTKFLQSGETLLHVPYWQRPLVACDALAFYLCKIVWPATLAIDYGRRPLVIFQQGWAYWTWLLPAALAVALLLFRRRARVVIAGALVFLAPLCPVLGLLQFDFQGFSSVADRYLYLSLVGAAICFAWAVQRTGSIGLIAAGLLLTLLVGRSWFQTGYWHDSRRCCHMRWRLIRSVRWH